MAQSQNSVIFLFETTLPRLPKQHEVQTLAETAGTVLRIFLETNKFQAIVEYSSDLEALAAIQILNKSKFPDYGKLTVKKMFLESDKPVYCHSRTTKTEKFETESCRTPFALKITGLTENMDSNGLKKYIGESADCVFSSCHYQEGKGCGFLCFSTRMDMVNGYNALCGIKIRGSLVKVEYENESLAEMRVGKVRTEGRALSPIPNF